MELRVVGDVAAGAAPDVTVEPGTAARIATGARLPDGADAVVPVEATTPLDAAGRPGPRGRDATGPVPSPASSTSRSGPVARSARQGAISPLARRSSSRAPRSRPPPWHSWPVRASPEIRVHRRPRIAVLATGDEVRAPGEPLGPAGIPDANGPGLRAQVTAAGGEAIDLGIATDDLDDVVTRLRRGLAAGRRCPHRRGRRLGRAVRRRQDRDRDDRPHRSLAGRRPARQAVRVRHRGAPGGGGRSCCSGCPATRSRRRSRSSCSSARHPGDGRPPRPAPAGRSRRPRRGRHQEPRPARLPARQAERDDAGAPVRDERGRVRVHLAGGQGSHVISALAAADALAVIPEADDSLPAGAEVALWWLDRA